MVDASAAGSTGGRATRRRCYPILTHPLTRGSPYGEIRQINPPATALMVHDVARGTGGRRAARREKMASPTPRRAAIDAASRGPRVFQPFRQRPNQGDRSPPGRREKRGRAGPFLPPLLLFYLPKSAAPKPIASKGSIQYFANLRKPRIDAE
jgi:hypothetical protein